MKTKRAVRWGLLTGALTCAAVAGMPGCELLVDFDRSKIPGGDASLEDAEILVDGANVPEATPNDAGGEAGLASPDAGPDATADAADAGDTGSMSADGSDASSGGGDGSATDAAETGTPPIEAGADASADAAAEADTDANADGGDGS